MVDLCLLCIERQKGGELKMFCRKCGLKLKEGDKYCWKCGADIIVKPEDKSTVNSRWLTWVMLCRYFCVSMAECVWQSKTEGLYECAKNYEYMVIR